MKTKKEEKMISITVRMPQEIRDRIYEFAEKERRSVNSEIVHLLEISLGTKALVTPKKETSKK
ncbi:MAG: hypothetical protein CV087_21940 [Candidatus Brocadia sp. WS118]|nr:MAG: hypothetical protein CV087_21940 [Candidatus Brocadia sp. WS118]